MSQLPYINSSRSSRAATPSSALSPSVQHTFELLQSLSQEASLPSDLKRKLHQIIADANIVKQKSSHGDTKGDATTDATVPPHSFREMVSGHHPIRRNLLIGNPAMSSPQTIDLSVPRYRSSASSVPTSSIRERSPLQDPKDVFDIMDRVTIHTLRYVDSIAEIEFDIEQVKEYDGTPMVDPERLFLSVCCSVFSNFAFCNADDFDLRKFVFFLRHLFTFYIDNPYHNALHAADALQMLSLFFRDPSINFFFSDDDILLSFLGVLTLDVAHTGLHDSSLCYMDHPLVTVFGDIGAGRRASLLVVLHELFLDTNFFFHSTSTYSDQQVLRESLTYLMTDACIQLRPNLQSKLNFIAECQRVRSEDIPALTAALVLIAHDAFALRPHRQFLRYGKKLVTEFCREQKEMQRLHLPCQLPVISADGVNRLVVDYCTVIVRSLADRVRALVPTDLYDNLSYNADPSTATKDVIVLSEDLSYYQWNDNTGVVIEMLKKATTHADSVDRKASKSAILNALPPRSGLQSASARRGSPCEPAGSWLGSPQPGVDADGPSSLSATFHANHRSEHYFSFLRLYDKCECEGETLMEFGRQLVFLALQLNTNYISSAARDGHNMDNAGSETCRDIVRYLLENEEAPSSAEAMASRHALSGLGPAFSEAPGDDTDGFLLFLLEMYGKRDQGKQPVDSDYIPLLSSTPDQRRGANPRSFSEPLMPQRDSPIRMPVNTDTSRSYI